MKYLCFILAACFFQLAIGQPVLPDFLQGTWKMENKAIYEHWDMLNSHTMKGFSYKVKDGHMQITEYLDIAQNGEDIVYTATVIQQNQGRGIAFTLTHNDSAFIFENPDHDFPKRIVYRKLSDTEIFVQVSDGMQKGFAYKMIKQLPGQAETVANPAYDKALAEKLGADDYGMKSYFLVILKTGDNTSADKELISSSFRGHMENIRRLVDEGQLIIAGPLGKNDNNYRGIFILHNIQTAEEAKALLLTDPAIANGLLDFELFSWYGSAALPEYLPYSDKIWKLKP